MRKRNLQKLFAEKITLEINNYKKEMLKNKKEIIMENVYQIDSMINIYEILLEMSRKVSGHVLETLLVFPNLLAFLYDEWLGYDDSYIIDLENCLNDCIKELSEKDIRKGVHAS